MALWRLASLRFALLRAALLCFASLSFALLRAALLRLASPCFALLRLALLCVALLCVALLCFALLCFALLLHGAAPRGCARLLRGAPLGCSAGLLCSGCPAGLPRESPARWDEWVCGALRFGLSLRFGAFFGKSASISAVYARSPWKSSSRGGFAVVVFGKTHAAAATATIFCKFRPCLTPPPKYLVL